VFHLDVAYVCNGFQMFSDVFASVSDACFKSFIYLLLYVATVAFGCFKSRSGVAHGMCVGSSWLCERCPGQRGPAVGTLACKPDALGCSLAERVPSDVSAPDRMSGH